MTTPNLHYAGFWRRLAAVLLDALLVLFLTAPLLYLIYGHAYFSWLAANNDLLNVYGIWDFLLSRALPILALLIFWHQCGATPGKRLMHCRIVHSRQLTRPGILQSVIRLLAYTVSTLPMYLGFFWIAWDKRKQGFHDKLARTLVLYHPDDYAEQSLAELMEQVA